MLEGSGARVALGQNFGKEVENGRPRSFSGQKRGSKTGLPWFDLRSSLIFNL